MKKYIFSLMLSFCSILSLSAMSYEEAREQARFLTDKMAYELNLNEQQYNDCYEINLDYLLSVETADEIYGDYLAYRNADLRHILYDWQYTIFAAADYFFRPLAWMHNRWFFPIYRHYNVGYYYYGHPKVYYSYRGGHGRFYHHGGYYVSRRPHWTGGFRGTNRHPMNHHGNISHHSGRGNGYHFGEGRHGGRDHDRGSNNGRFGHDGNHRGGNNPGYHIGDGGSHREVGGGRGGSHHEIGDGRGGSHHGTGNGSRGYDRPSSTRTTVHASNGSTPHSGGFSSGSHSSTPRGGGFSTGSHSGFRSGGFSSGSHSSTHRGGGFSGGSHSGSHSGSRGGGSHSGSSHGSHRGR